VILCIGGTPAVQRTLLFDRLDVGNVNRAHTVHITAAGKAVNAARAVTTLGGRALLVTFLGGDSGRFVSRNLGTEGVPHEAIWVEDDAPTRTCSTLLSRDGAVTELVEEAPPVSERDVADLELAVERHLHEAQALCLIGSFPPGVPDDTYARFTKLAARTGVPVLVDAQKALLLHALNERPFIVKPNLEETAAALGETVEVTGAGETGALGAALCAGVGIGTYKSINDATDNVVRRFRTHEPDARNSKRYAEAYETYMGLVDALGPVWSRTG
jgi:fructose-1-phosphate kinase PfkB-like protein